MIAAGVVGMADSNAQQADAKPDYHSDAHLQRVLNWTDAERQTASDAARKLQANLNAAIAAKAQAFRIPPGDYTEWMAPGQNGHRSVLTLMGAENMHIDATGLQGPARHRAMEW